MCTDYHGIVKLWASEGAIVFNTLNHSLHDNTWSNTLKITFSRQPTLYHSNNNPLFVLQDF